MDVILSQTRLISEEDAKKVREEFEQQEDVIKVSCFSDFLEEIDKYGN